MVIVAGLALWFLPPRFFNLFVAAILLVGAWEWSMLLKLERLPRFAYLAGFAVLLGLMLTGNSPPMRILIGGSVLWWGAALVLVICYPRGGHLWQNTPVLLLLSVLVLLPAMGALMTLRSLPDYVAYMLIFLALVAAADIGAFFSGKAFGKLKLAPRVSPNKTWEGFTGGLVSTLVVGMCALSQFPRVHDIAPLSLVLAICGIAGLAVFSVVGDLFESMLKRYSGAKDSSWLLPGHGGVLDRLDSITAALPVYVIILYLLELL